MNHLMPQRHWGLWMRMHEPLGLSLRTQFVVHFWANWHMLLQWRDLVTSSLFALIPTAAMALALWTLKPFRRGGVLDFATTDGSTLLLAGVAIIVPWLAVQHLFFVYAMQRWYAPYVRRELIRRGNPMCERCGHRLPPSPPTACPECGVRLQQESKAVSG